MEPEPLRLSLVPSPDDPPARQGAYQRELANIDRALRDLGLPGGRMFFRDAVGAGAGFTGEFIVTLAAVVPPTLAAIFVAWIKEKVRRRIRMKIGDLQVEAHTPEEVAKLLEQAAAYQAKRTAKKKTKE